YTTLFRSVEDQHAGRAIARILPIRRQRRVVRAKRERIRLGAAIGAEVAVEAELDEVAGDRLRALVQELVERMLAHRALGAEQYRRGGIGDLAALAVDALAVRLHLELLEVRREQPQRVGVRQHGVRCEAKEVRVPRADQRHQDRDVLLERRPGEMLVYVAS